MIKGGENALAVAGWGYFQLRSFHTPHLYPKIGVPGAMFPGERGNAHTRGYDELGTARKGDEQRIKLGFQLLGAAECESYMWNHTRPFWH